MVQADPYINDKTIVKAREDKFAQWFKEHIISIDVNEHYGVDPNGCTKFTKLENTNSRHNAMDSLVLVCCKDALCVYPLKSMVQIFARPRTGESKTSLMSILRWSFKANMERTLSSMENGQIAM
ncbi:hypothetical protein Tco_0154175, partial [Tanacetum coccineum]